MYFLSNLFKRKRNNKFVPDLAFYLEVVDKIAIPYALEIDLKTELKKAFEDPKSFYDINNQYIFSERGLSYPKDALLTPKFVLIDTLQNNGQMAEVDWKEEESEIRIYLKEIGMAKNYDFALSDDNLYEGHDTGEIINLIAEKELEPNGYSIEVLDMNLDSYVFTIVPLNDKQKVKLMFEKLK